MLLAAISLAGIPNTEQSSRNLNASNRWTVLKTHYFLSLSVLGINTCAFTLKKFKLLAISFSGLQQCHCSAKIVINTFVLWIKAVVLKCCFLSTAPPLAPYRFHCGDLFLGTGDKRVAGVDRPAVCSLSVANNTQATQDAGLLNAVASLPIGLCRHEYCTLLRLWPALPSARFITLYVMGKIHCQ
jgi:hypothetical protein